MTKEDHAIGDELLQLALDRTDHPDKATGLLVSAAATILERRFGKERAIEYLIASLDIAGAKARAGARG